MGDLASRLRTQAEHCANGGSPLYARLLERAAADVEAGGPAARLLRGHESDPSDSALPLRMMGAVHRRVLEGQLVFHSIVVQYLSREEREELKCQLLQAAQAASEPSPLAWLRMEPAGERAEVRLTRWPGGEDLSLAQASYHGDVLEMQPA